MCSQQYCYSHLEETLLSVQTGLFARCPFVTEHFKVEGFLKEYAHKEAQVIMISLKEELYKEADVMLGVYSVSCGESAVLSFDLSHF